MCADAGRSTKEGSLLAPVKTIAWGVLWLVGACWFWWHEIGGNPLNELALIRRAQVTTGSLIDTYEHEQEDDRGHVYFSDVGVYAYRVPDGREFKTLTRVPTGQLEERRQVEYLPDKPAVSRIKGHGCQTVTDWLWRKVGLGSFLLLLICSPGICLIQTGLRGTKRLLAARRESPLLRDQ
jgi:hypothetical protein